MASTTYRSKPLAILVGAVSLGMLVSLKSFAAESEKAQEGAGANPTHQVGGSIGTRSSTAPSDAGISTEGGLENLRESQTGGSKAVPGMDSGEPISNADQSVMRELAQAHLAEWKMAELAQTISQDPTVRNYAQRMIDDHSKALAELRRLADEKGVILPGGADKKHAALLNRLASLTSKEFDREYMTHAGAREHAESHQLLQQASQQAKDPQLKQHIAKTVAIVQQHSQMAQQMGYQAQSTGTSGTDPGASAAQQSSAGSGTPAGTGSGTGSTTGAASHTGGGSAANSGK